MQQSPINLSTGGGLAAILLWSGTFAFARSLSEQIGPLTAGAVAYLLGGAFCLIRLWWMKTPAARFRELPRLYLFGCGSLFVFYTAAIYLAVGLANNREQTLQIALINYLWPSLTIVLALPLLGQRARWWLAPATLLGLAGMALVLTQEAAFSWAGFRDNLRANPRACLLALLAAISWALYSNLARRWSRPGAGGAVELFMPATGLVLLGLSLLAGETARWSWRSAGEVCGLAAITTAAYALWDVAMRRGKLTLVAAASYFTPLFSTLVSSAYLRVAPGPKLWIGCALLVGGSLLSWRALDRYPPAAGTES